MARGRLIGSDVTPDNEPIELFEESGYFVIRLAGKTLMSSAMRGSEKAMAAVAAARISRRRPQDGAKVLVGGLGLGFTLRAALDQFGAKAKVTVAELLPVIVRFNRTELGDLADRPLDDPRVTLFEGDVSDQLESARWDTILLDVDNGPDAFTIDENGALYSRSGITRMMASLMPGGVVVIWSAFASQRFVRDVKRWGFDVETKRVRARESGKGPIHTLFILSSRKHRRR